MGFSGLTRVSAVRLRRACDPSDRRSCAYASGPGVNARPTLPITSSTRRRAATNGGPPMTPMFRNRLLWIVAVFAHRGHRRRRARARLRSRKSTRPKDMPYDTPGEIPQLSPKYKLTEHEVVLITDQALNPRLVTLSEGQLVAWISYSGVRLPSSCSSARSARSMVCHSLVNFSHPGGRAALGADPRRGVRQLLPAQARALPLQGRAPRSSRGRPRRRAAHRGRDHRRQSDRGLSRSRSRSSFGSNCV